MKTQNKYLITPFSFHKYYIREHNEKIAYILNELYEALHPILRVTPYQFYDWKTGKSINKKVETSINVGNSYDITIPWPNIALKITNEMITIEGETFQYKFPPSMIIEIRKRMLHAFKQCR